MPRTTRRAFAGLALASLALAHLAASAALAQGADHGAAHGGAAHGGADQGAELRAGDIRITQPWSRAAMRGGSGAAFLTLRNTGNQPDRLLGASTPAAGRVELHSMVRDGDVMRMREQPAIELPPGQEVILRPGGLHVMLLGLTAPLNRGEAVTLTLRFERAGTVEVPFAVQAAGASGMMHHRH